MHAKLFWVGTLVAALAVGLAGGYGIAQADEPAEPHPGRVNAFRELAGLVYGPNNYETVVYLETDTVVGTEAFGTDTTIAYDDLQFPVRFTFVHVEGGTCRATYRLRLEGGRFQLFRDPMAPLLDDERMDLNDPPPVLCAAAEPPR